MLRVGARPGHTRGRYVTCTFSEKTFQPAITPFNRWDMGGCRVTSPVPGPTSLTFASLDFKYRSRLPPSHESVPQCCPRTLSLGEGQKGQRPVAPGQDRTTHQYRKELHACFFLHCGAKSPCAVTSSWNTRMPRGPGDKCILRTGSSH